MKKRKWLEEKSVEELKKWHKHNQSFTAIIFVLYAIIFCISFLMSYSIEPILSLQNFATYMGITTVIMTQIWLYGRTLMMLKFYLEEE